MAISTGLSGMAGSVSPSFAGGLQSGLQSDDPMQRQAAVEAYAASQPARQAALVAAMKSDVLAKEFNPAAAGANALPSNITAEWRTTLSQWHTSHLAALPTAAGQKVPAPALAAAHEEKLRLLEALSHAESKGEASRVFENETARRLQQLNDPKLQTR